MKSYFLPLGSGAEQGLSAMLTGNPYFCIYPYHSEDEVFSLLNTILKKDDRS